METPISQHRLQEDQIAQFYHDLFVTGQVEDFRILHAASCPALVIDVGGGCGFFAEALAKRLGCTVKVLDSDPVSVRRCAERGIPAKQGDALSADDTERADTVCFNLMLHHLVGDSESITRTMQRHALALWKGQAGTIFVNEYIYDSALQDLSGWLIYQVTSNALLSAIGRIVGRFVPALRANTFGVGVRFRSVLEWREVFREAGYEVILHRLGEKERVAAPLRLLFIRQVRRDSFLLRPAG